MTSPNVNIMRDIGILLLSILVAVMLKQMGVIKELMDSTKDFTLIGSFIAGFFFVSAFTVAPSIAMFSDLSRTDSIYMVALVGSIGALVGDLLIFQFVEDHLFMDFKEYIKHSKFRKIIFVFKYKFLRWIFSILGALIVASPLPDDLGLAMMGLTKINTYIFIPLCLVLNFIGILGIELLARQ